MSGYFPDGYFPDNYFATNYFYSEDSTPTQSSIDFDYPLTAQFFKTVNSAVIYKTVYSAVIDQ